MEKLCSFFPIFFLFTFAEAEGPCGVSTSPFRLDRRHPYADEREINYYLMALRRQSGYVSTWKLVIGSLRRCNNLVLAVLDVSGQIVLSPAVTAAAGSGTGSDGPQMGPKSYSFNMENLFCFFVFSGRRLNGRGGQVIDCIYFGGKANNEWI